MHGVDVEIKIIKRIGEPLVDEQMVLLATTNNSNKSMVTTTTIAPSTIENKTTIELQINQKNQIVSDTTTTTTTEKCCGNGNNNSVQYQHSKINQCNNSNIEMKGNNGTTRNSTCNCQGMYL